MTSPVAASVTATQQTTQVTTWAVITAGAPLSVSTGDIVHVWVSNQTGAANTLNSGSSSAGWTRTDKTATINLVLYSYTAASSTTINLTVDCASASRLSAVICKTTGGTATYLSSTANGSGASADPPNNAPGIGSQDFIAYTIVNVGASTTVAAPSTYTFGATGAATGTTTSASYKTLTGVSSENPGIAALGTGSSQWNAVTVMIVGPIPLNYTLPVTTGSYSLVGQSIAFRVGLSLPATTGVYSLSGQAVGFSVGLSLPVATGAYALTGQAIGFARGYSLPIVPGAYVLAGSPIGLTSTRSMLIATGTYSYVGNAVNLTTLKVYNLSVDSGDYVLNGQDLLFKVNVSLPIDSGSYSYDGSDIGLGWGRSFAINTGAYVLIGNAVTMTAGKAPFTVPPNNYVEVLSSPGITYISAGSPPTIYVEGRRS